MQTRFYQQGCEHEVQVKGTFLLKTSSGIFSQFWWNHSLHWMHWAIFRFLSSCLLQLQKTLTVCLRSDCSSLLAPSVSHPGKGSSSPVSKHSIRWTLMTVWSHSVKPGNNPWHKDVAVAMAKRPQSLPPDWPWQLMARMVKEGAWQCRIEVICFTTAGLALEFRLS